jgi:hypothetical protein
VSLGLEEGEEALPELRRGPHEPDCMAG